MGYNGVCMSWYYPTYLRLCVYVSNDPMGRGVNHFEPFECTDFDTISKIWVYKMCDLCFQVLASAIADKTKHVCAVILSIEVIYIICDHTRSPSRVLQAIYSTCTQRRRVLCESS